MPNVKAMTPEEAYQKLAEMQEKARSRQRGHYQQSKEQGRAKVSVFLSEEASRILERERAEGRTISDILSVALVAWDKPKPRKAPSPLPTEEGEPSGDDKPFDEVKTAVRIMQLHNEGLSDSKVAKQLEAEGWLTATGMRRWNRTVVGRIRNKQ